MDAVVACDAKGGIAYKGKLPWHLPEDLKFFRDITRDRVIIMGRKTYDDMPKKISHERVSIVFSKQKLVDDKVHFVSSVEQCLEVVKRYPDKRACVIGGQDIFELFFDAGLIDRVYLTRVEGDYLVDRFFPLKEVKGWKESLVLSKAEFSLYCLEKS